jgi:predicted nuclease of predicted toxin-antitoxin system
MAGFLIDENLPHSLAIELQSQGHEAVHVTDVGLDSRSDEAVVAYARKRGLAVVTADKGLGNLRRFPLGTHCGILVSRLPDELLISEKIALILKAIASVDPVEIDGSLVVIGKTTLRVRHKRPRGTVQQQ